MTRKRSDTSEYHERNAWTQTLYDVWPDQPEISFHVLEHRYKESKNPLYAWQAFRQARQSNVAVPEWVLEYLHKSADNLLTMPLGLGKKTQAAIAEALGLKTVGNRSFFDRFWKLERDIQIYRLVQDEQEQNTSRMATTNYEVVGEKFGLTSGAVKTIVEKFSAFLKTVE